MNTSRTPFTSALLLSAALLFAACGSDETTVSSEGPDPDTSVSAPADGDGDATIDAPGDDATDAPEPAPAVADGAVLGSANMGGEIVDPARHAIDELLIMESYPEQLNVSFTAGAEPCLAATATATGTDTQIIVTLDVGITTDALTKSCIAVQEQHSLTIALSEGIDGREIVLAEAEEREPAGEPPAQAFETTLIGLSEESAEEAAADFGYEWRVVSRDGEDYAVTMDLIENRINATIVDGVVTDATLG
jgi:hypothetical protein